MSELIENMSMADYRALPYVSFHELDIIHKQSPLHFHLRQPVEQTDAMRMGSVFHGIIGKETIITVDAADKRSKAGKAAWDQYGGKCVPFATAEEILEAKTWVASLQSTPTGRYLLEADGLTEPVIIFDYKGRTWKARPDKIIRCAGILVDWKTAADGSPDKFRRSVMDYGYARQAWWYMLAAEKVGIQLHEAALGVVEKEPPCPAYVAQLSPAMLSAAGKEVDAAVDRLVACEASGVWPGYQSADGQDIITLDLTSWEYRKAFAAA